MTIIILAAALLPAILLWLYIWRMDIQKEPTSWLVKAVLYGVAICFPGIYDALAMSGMVNEIVGGISSFVLIYFCIKMHKFAKTKIVAQIERDVYNHDINCV